MLLLQWFKTYGPHEGFLTHQLINKGNKQIMSKAYDESEMRTRQKRFVTPGEEGKKHTQELINFHVRHAQYPE